MRPSFVITRMRFACAFADFAERSENGAIPPSVWQPAHFAAKIGATLAHVGAPPARATRRLSPEPEAIVVTAIATTATNATASASLLRFTEQG